MAEGIKLNEIDVNIENDPFENIKNIMEHIKSTMEDIKQKKSKLNNVVIKSFNDLNNKMGDNFYSKFISEINETKRMNDFIGNALDNINNKKNTELDNSIIKSFNELNNKIGDNFYSKFNKFISELNKTKHMNDTIGNTLNATNNKKNTELDNSIIKLFNANMVMTNKWLTRYFSLNNELMNAMKPDANIARNLSKVPTFLPNIGMGVITNKFGKRYGNMKDKFSNLKLPEIPNVLPPGLDYDTFNLVVKNENAENGNKEIILDEGKRLDKGNKDPIAS